MSLGGLLRRWRIPPFMSFWLILAWLILYQVQALAARALQSVGRQDSRLPSSSKLALSPARQIYIHLDVLWLNCLAVVHCGVLWNLVQSRGRAEGA